MYDTDPNSPHCECEWQYAWHYTGPKRKMQEWSGVLVEYRADCPLGQHAALAALLATPEPTPVAPTPEKAPSPQLVSRYIDRLESRVAAEGGYGPGVLDAYNDLHSHHAPTRERGLTAAAKILGDTK